MWQDTLNKNLPSFATFWQENYLEANTQQKTQLILKEQTQLL